MALEREQNREIDKKELMLQREATRCDSWRQSRAFNERGGDDLRHDDGGMAAVVDDESLREST